MKKMNPVVHFEMPAKDKKRVVDFYSKVFGWQMRQMGAQYGEYVLAMTTPSDEKGPKKKGAINGGLFKLQKSKGTQYPSVVISVEDIKEKMGEVKKAGGKVLGGAFKAEEA